MTAARIWVSAASAALVSGSGVGRAAISARSTRPAVEMLQRP
ncbi:hypothetical protein [Plantactinospora mayteni]|nr:hypothetical protein [Plantactinospora mayteni]